MEEKWPGSEVIVADDGSTDDTVQIVELFGRSRRGGVEIRCVQLGRNRGKGAAVRTGVLEATRPMILFSDAGGSTPIEEVEKLKRTLDDGADIAFASRAISGSSVEVRQPFASSFIEGIAFDVEILWLANRGGFQAVEVPVRWLDDADTAVSLLRHGPRMLLDVLLVRWRHRADPR